MNSFTHTDGGSSPPLFLKYSVSFHMRGIRRSGMTTDKGLDHKNVNHLHCPTDMCVCVCLSAHLAFSRWQTYSQLITVCVLQLGISQTPSCPHKYTVATNVASYQYSSPHLYSEPLKTPNTCSYCWHPTSHPSTTIKKKSKLRFYFFKYQGKKKRFPIISLFTVLSWTHTWDCHFSFAWEPVIHRPRIWRPAWHVLHDLGFLHPLQLWHVGHDTSAARLQALRCLQSLVSLRAGGQQFAGSIAHPDLMVNLLLNIAVLQRETERGENRLKCWIMMYFCTICLLQNKDKMLSGKKKRGSLGRN